VQHPYYEMKKGDFLKQMEGFMLVGHMIMQKHYNDEFISRVLKESNNNFSVILENLPYIGGDENRLTDNLVGASMILALHQSIKANGKNVEDSAKIAYEILEYAYSNQLIKVQQMTRDPSEIAEVIQEERRLHAFFQRIKYPQNWVAEYIDGTGTEFDYGWDYYECGIVKLMKQYEAIDLAPYMCLLDYITHKAQCKGLKRTKTLAHGDNCCDMRIRLGSNEIILEVYSEAKLKEWNKLI